MNDEMTARHIGAPQTIERELLGALVSVGQGLLLRSLTSIARPRSDAETDPLQGRPLRVLFIREDDLGEVVLAHGALRAIAESYPGTLVDLVTSADNAAAVHGLRYINDVISFPRSDRRQFRVMPAMLRRRPYDVAIDATVRGSHVRARSIALMLASRAPYWIGEVGRRNDCIYNVRVPRAEPGLPYVDRMMRLAAPLLPRGATLADRARAS